MNAVSGWLRRVALGMLLGVLVLAAVSARVINQGEAELGVSDAAFDRGDLRESILHARRAAVLYAPGAPHVPAAYERLFAVARGAEASGQVELARQAFGAMRGAALETRHVWVPREGDLTRANAGLARLAAQAGSGAAAQSLALKLVRDDAPRAPWIFVLAAGLSLFATGLGLLAFRGVTPSGTISRKGLLVALLVCLSGVACWTLSVYRA